MAAIPEDSLKKEIHAILEDADLSLLSAKKIRLQLEETMGCELLSRKEEIDRIVMTFINSQKDADDDDDSSEEEEEEVDDKPKSRKRVSNNKKSTPAKKKRSGDSDNESASAKSEVSDYKPAKRTAAPKRKKGGRKRGSASDRESDEDYVKPKAAPKKSKGTGKPRGTGFTRSIALSPALAELMGSESLPRHEVVKKMWSIIKEKNLYCPKNKQFAICDEALYKVMGVKRFRTFGMLKYLKSHFVD